MAMDGLLALVCAGAVMTAGPSPSSPAAAGENRDSAVATTLAVQTAMQQGRDHLLHGEYRHAVAALESQLPYINGNPVYLKLLQEAYRRYIQELRLSKQDAEAQRYLRRLLILDHGAILDQSLTGGDSAPSKAPAAKATKAAAQPPAKKPAPIVRLKSEDEDPFETSRALPKPDNRARQLLTRAEKEFSNQHYREARLLYEQADDADHSATSSYRERWAYCKLYCVVDELNRADVVAPNWAELEREVARALELAPTLPAQTLDFGKYLLAEIQRRRTAETIAKNRLADPPVPVRHHQGRSDGWLVAETTNFRIFHNQAPEFAERIAQVAENTRVRLQRKWFGGTGDAWSPKCDIFLHATAQDYSRTTGQYHSPGHSYLKLESGRLVVRRIDLHCDDANLLRAILPHEVTHIVLAGEFGERLLPRWADEGMAVLTEPRERIDRHLNNLLHCREAGQSIRLQQLMQMEEYPEDTRYITVFYAESVALVEFLTNQRGPQAFTQFLHDGMRYGYEKALERNYGYKSFADLEQRWAPYAYRDRTTASGVAER